MIEDTIVISVLKEKSDSLGDEQILVDGFPRSSIQAESLKEIFLNKNLNIINFTVTDEELLARIKKRSQEESRADDSFFDKRLQIYKKSHLEILNSVSGGGIYLKTGTSSPYTNATNSLVVESAGDVEIVKGDIYFGTSGKGIVLGATSNTAANTLDDYEEGTFTPTYTTSNGDIGTVTYDVRTGRYTKIGRMVYFTLRLRTDSISDRGSGTIKITGFPFTHKNSSSHRAVTNSIYSAGWTSNDSPTLGLFLSNDSALQLYQKDFDNDGAGLPASAFNTGANDNDVRMTGFYEATS